MLLLHQSALGLFRLINYLGRKGIEPSTAKGYWVYSSTRHTNKRNLPLVYNILNITYSLLFTLITPVQFPLHEPYFDLTPIEVTHTKIN